MKNSLSLFTDSQLNLELEIRAEGEGVISKEGFLTTLLMKSALN